MNANVLQWDGGPGHYEVYYLSVTDPRSATGLWIRYTMRSPLTGAGECSLWFMAMDRDGARFARKATYPIEELVAEPDPFRLTLAGADLSDRGMAGGFEDVAWELLWEPSLPAAEHVHPLLRRAGHRQDAPRARPSGPRGLGHGALRRARARPGRRPRRPGAPVGLQARLALGVGARQRPAQRGGRAASGRLPRRRERLRAALRAASWDRARRVVGRFGGDDFRSTSPLHVTRNASRFGLTTWRFEARDGKRKVIGEVDAPRGSLVGVTYHDPDGDLAYCYNSEVASMRLFVWDRTSRGRFGWTLRDTLVADGNAHFEYAQRAPVDGVELLVT